MWVRSIIKNTDLFFGLQHIGAKAIRVVMKEKGKHMRSNDIPPEPSQEIKHQQECLLNLRKHLRCSSHLMPGCPVYCWPKPGGQGLPGGHQELSHEEMTLWAKYMVSKVWVECRKVDAYQLTYSRLAK